MNIITLKNNNNIILVSNFSMLVYNTTNTENISLLNKYTFEKETTSITLI